MDIMSWQTGPTWANKLLASDCITYFIVELISRAHTGQVPPRSPQSSEAYSKQCKALAPHVVGLGPPLESRPVAGNFEALPGAL